MFGDITFYAHRRQTPKTKKKSEVEEKKGKENVGDKTIFWRQKLNCTVSTETQIEIAQVLAGLCGGVFFM